jgi:predicted PhzF superfamily epimerase YddE/YHI9
VKRARATVFDPPNLHQVPTLHVLRVFVNEDGEWGNPLGVFLDGGRVPERARQQVAAELGFSETVFVEDRDSGRMRIHTPAAELPFAGHPAVGTAWLLARAGNAVRALRPPAGRVEVRHREGATWAAAPAEWALLFEYPELESPAAVRALSPAAYTTNTYAWSWIDEAAGTVRARSFAPAAGIAEDEATGSAAIALCARLSRPVTIHQGHGSVLRCRPIADGRVEVGGKVALDEVRDHPVEFAA